MIVKGNQKYIQKLWLTNSNQFNLQNRLLLAKI